MPASGGVYSRIPGLQFQQSAYVVPTKVLAVLEQKSSGTAQKFLGFLAFTKFLSHFQSVHRNN